MGPDVLPYGLEVKAHKSSCMMKEKEGAFHAEAKGKSCLSESRSSVEVPFRAGVGLMRLFT